MKIRVIVNWLEFVLLGIRPVEGINWTNFLYPYIFDRSCIIDSERRTVGLSRWRRSDDGGHHSRGR